MSVCPNRVPRLPTGEGDGGGGGGGGGDGGGLVHLIMHDGQAGF